MSHTPGPWVQRPAHWVHAVRGGAICELFGRADEIIANGALIAAASDLLAACKAARDAIEDMDESWYMPPELKTALGTIKAAIAKAEGDA